MSSRIRSVHQLPCCYGAARGITAAKRMMRFCNRMTSFHVRRYPKIIVECKEAEQEWVEGVEVPVDTSLPNPNEMEFDNLYLVSRFGAEAQVHERLNRSLSRVSLDQVGVRYDDALKLLTRKSACLQDMNNIIHPCFHPEDRVRQASIIPDHALHSISALPCDFADCTTQQLVALR